MYLKNVEGEKHGDIHFPPVPLPTFIAPVLSAHLFLEGKADVAGCGGPSERRRWCCRWGKPGRNPGRPVSERKETRFYKDVRVEGDYRPLNSSVSSAFPYLWGFPFGISVRFRVSHSISVIIASNGFLGARKMPSYFLLLLPVLAVAGFIMKVGAWEWEPQLCCQGAWPGVGAVNTKPRPPPTPILHRPQRPGGGSQAVSQ